MSDTKYYVRSRGKVSGPFELPTLVKMVRRAALGAMDEISEDRRSWVRAGEYEDLFPARKAAVVAAVVSDAEVRESVDSEEIPFAPRPDPEAMCQGYFYQQGGVAVGPVPMAILHALAENGTLTEDDLVWQDGSPTMSRAGQLTALGSVFYGAASRMRRSGAPGRPAGPSARFERGDDSRIALYNNATSTKVLLLGFSLATVLLLAIHLPWFPVGNHVVGWWSALESASQSTDAQQGVAALLLNVVIFSLSGLTLLIVLPLTKGQPRSIVCMAIGGIGIFFYLIPLFSLPGASVTLLMFSSLYLIPVASNGLAAVLNARKATDGRMAGNVAVGILSGIAGLCALIVVAVCVPQLINFSRYTELFVGALLLVIAHVIIIASSVLGFVGLKPTYSPGLNMATIICARIGTALIMLSLMIMILDLSAIPSFLAALGNPDGTNTNALDVKFWVTISLIRLLLVATFYPSIAILGIEEFSSSSALRRVK